MKCTNPCGVSTHISIANEALQSYADSAEYSVSYRDIVLNNYDAFYAGSNYPDAMYSSICFGGRYHDISEDTHWTPFLNATINYIRKTYSKPWNKVGQANSKYKPYIFHTGGYSRPLRVYKSYISKMAKFYKKAKFRFFKKTKKKTLKIFLQSNVNLGKSQQFEV